MIRKHLFGLALLFLLFWACKEAKNNSSAEVDEIQYIIDDAAISRLDTTLKSYVDSGTIAGISTLIYEKDKEVYYNAFGYADRDLELPMARNTIVQIYSMTKPITGTALMTLYDENKFELDDAVAKYAPEFKDIMVYEGEDASGNPILESPKRPMTIRDLTRHTAGFGRNSNIPGLGKLIAEADALNRENTLVQMAEKMGATPLYFHPGEQWEYGPCVDVQAFLVERISGQPYEAYVRTHVLDPLGMKETRYFVPEEDRNRFSAMYFRDEDGTLRQLSEEESKSDYLQKWPMTRGGSGLTSTLDNYMQFARMLVNKGTLDSVTILKPETVELMATNHLADSVEERSFLPSKGQVGFGIDFAVRLLPPAGINENNGVVGEFFWDGAASTLFWVDPVNELTAVMFVQLFPYDQVKLHKNFRDAVYGPVVVNEED
ncbi:MAG: beta-lactamase family protein [Eudoraea sp.]|nr:beta-lactamase family protein [Eudoraea sp.]